MAADESEIGGSNGRRIQLRAPRGARKAKPKRNSFTRERKEIFLAHFAATANSDGAGRAAGVSKSTVYEHRRKDQQFREAWNEALGEGYARVEAHSVRYAEKAFQVRADPRAGKSVRDMDPKVALAILESYRRNGNRRPGEIFPQPYDVGEVRRRLEAKMRMLGFLDDESDPGRSDDKPSEE
jgi:hypothetical protein